MSFEQGNNNSDPPQPIDKKEVLSLIDKQIKKLETYDTSGQRLFDENELIHDELKLRDQNMTSVSKKAIEIVLVELKLLYKKVENL